MLEWHGAREPWNKVEQGAPKGQKDEKRLWKFPECNSGIRDRGLRLQLRASKRIKDLDGRQPLYLRKERITTNSIRGCLSHV
jgi:hypothetical protein